MRSRPPLASSHTYSLRAAAPAATPFPEDLSVFVFAFPLSQNLPQSSSLSQQYHSLSNLDMDVFLIEEARLSGNWGVQCSVLSEDLGYHQVVYLWSSALFFLFRWGQWTTHLSTWRPMNASAMTDLRPIACCNFLYKIGQIDWKGSLLPEAHIYTTNQGAFLSGRVISDCTLLAHEALRGFQHRRGTEQGLSKGGLEESLWYCWDREFLLHLLGCLGFDPIWIHWMEECLCTPSSSVLVDGVPTGLFKSNRGLRQGYLLSSYLFTVIMESFTVFMDRRSCWGWRLLPSALPTLPQCPIWMTFWGWKSRRKGYLRSLQGAQYIRVLVKINKEKSKLFLGAACGNRASLCQAMGMQES